MPSQVPSETSPQSQHSVSRVAGGALLGLLLLAAWIVVRLADPGPLVALRHLGFDTFQRIEPRRIDQPLVAVVDIDERSLAAIGQWPWPRTILGDLVDRLAAAGAVAIGFDVLFAEPDRLSAPELARALGAQHPELSARLAQLPDGDHTFAVALARSPTVLGVAGTAPRDDSRAPTVPLAAMATIGGDARGDVTRYPALLGNRIMLDEAARGRGLVSVVPDQDGVIRRVPLLATAGGNLVPALSLEVIRVASGGGTTVVKRDAAGVRSVVIAGVEVPTDRGGHLWPHFGAHDPRRFVSAVDVLQGREATAFAGKIVLVGTSAAGLFDLRTTPIERVVPGVEIHAQAVEAILDGAFLTRPNYATGAEIALAAAVGVAVMISMPMFGAAGALVFGGVLASALIATSWVLFSHARILLDVSFVLLSSGSVFLLLVFQKYLQEERQRTTIRDAFRQYLSSEMVERLVREPNKLKLGGETRDVTVMFTDFRGFTSIAEGFKSNPEGLTRLMNALLTPLSRAIVERRGTIDKYMGDAIMAFWNAPLDDANHSRNACLAALDIVARLDALNADLLRSPTNDGIGPKPLQIGIGIASGLNVVGNMGSDIRFDYTVLGDSVNVASRLQALSQHHGARILVAASTVALADGLAFLEVDHAVLKGRREPETVYALVGDADERTTPAFDQLAAGWIAARACVAVGDFDEARRRLSGLPVDVFPEAKPVVAALLARVTVAAEARQPKVDRAPEKEP